MRLLACVFSCHLVLLRLLCSYYGLNPLVGASIPYSILQIQSSRNSGVVAGKEFIQNVCNAFYYLRHVLRALNSSCRPFLPPWTITFGHLREGGRAQHSNIWNRYNEHRQIWTIDKMWVIEWMRWGDNDGQFLGDPSALGAAVNRLIIILSVQGFWWQIHYGRCIFEGLLTDLVTTDWVMSGFFVPFGSPLPVTTISTQQTMLNELSGFSL